MPGTGYTCVRRPGKRGWDKVLKVVPALLAGLALAIGPGTPVSAMPRQTGGGLGAQSLLEPAMPSAGELANCETNATGAAQPTEVVAASCTDVIDDLASMGPDLGLPTIPLVSKPGANGFQLNFSPAPNASTPGADASTRFNGASPCYITIYPVLWDQVRSGGASHGTYAFFVFEHEVVHCYQLQVWGSQSVAATAPGFISEGSAEYLAAEAALYDPDPEYWSEWFNPAAPQPSLLSRNAGAATPGYSAIGWYSVVAGVRGSLWPVMASAWRAYAAGGAGAFIHALGGDTTAVEVAMGPALVNDPSWGRPWVTDGIGIPAEMGGRGNSGWAMGVLPAWSGAVDEVRGVSTPVLLVHISGGYASAHDELGHQIVGFTSAVLCVLSSGCEPPEVTCTNGSPVTVADIIPPFTLAVSSAGAGATFSLTPAKTVNAAPENDNLCQGPTGFSLTALEHYANNPCDLLSDGDWAAATGITPSLHSTTVSSDIVGQCEWDRPTPVQQNYLLGLANIQKIPWLTVLDEFPSTKRAVSGVGEQAWCVDTPHQAPTATVDVLVELNTNWSLGNSGPSCSVARHLALEALERVASFG